MELETRKNIFEMDRNELLEFFYPLKEKMKKATVINNRINHNKQVIVNSNNEISQLNNVIASCKGAYKKYIPNVLKLCNKFLEKPKIKWSFYVRGEEICVHKIWYIIKILIMALLVIALMSALSTSVMRTIITAIGIVGFVGILHAIGHIRYALDKNKPDVKAIGIKITNLRSEIKKAEGFIRQDIEEKNAILRNIDNTLNNELHYSYFTQVAFDGIIYNLEKRSCDKLKECLRVVDNDENVRKVNENIMEGFEQTNQNINEGFIQTNQNINEGFEQTNQNIDYTRNEVNRNIDQTRREINQNIDNLGNKVDDLGDKVDNVGYQVGSLEDRKIQITVKK